MNIDHINISAPKDLLREVKYFYCTVLDLQEGYRPSSSRPGFWLYSGDRPLVHLTESKMHYGGEWRGYLDHVAFQTEDLAAVVEGLKLLGVSYRKTHVPDTGVTQLFFEDPAGTGLEVNSIDRS